MSLVIVSPTRIEVDGIDAGKLIDYILAHPADKALLDRALLDWHASHVIAEQKREQAKASAIKEAADEIAAKEAEHAEVVAELTAQVETLGGPELAEQKARDEKRAQALALKAQADALLAEIDGPLPADAKAGG